MSTAAIEVGFNTMAAFYNAFKKHTNMTPTQYKKETGHS
ncbi:MAG: helix-turn-helix domain-containing protein [Candidatus Aminicenantes bacterium]